MYLEKSAFKIINYKKYLSIEITSNKDIINTFLKNKFFEIYISPELFLKGYSKNEIVYIIPPFLDLLEGNYSEADGDWVDIDTLTCKRMNSYDDADPVNTFLFSLHNNEMEFHILQNKGWTENQASQILNNSVKTKITVNGSKETWLNFLNENNKINEVFQGLKTKVEKYEAN